MNQVHNTNIVLMNLALGFYTHISCRIPSEDGDKFVADAYPLPGTPEVKTTDASYQDYARNLGLISEADQTKLVEHYSAARDTRNNIRYKTFIPDYCSEVRCRRSKGCLEAMP